MNTKSDLSPEVQRIADNVCLSMNNRIKNSLKLRSSISSDGTNVSGYEITLRLEGQNITMVTLTYSVWLQIGLKAWSYNHLIKSRKDNLPGEEEQLTALSLAFWQKVEEVAPDHGSIREEILDLAADFNPINKAALASFS